MDGKTYLQFNLPNWITVLIMATVGMAFIGLVRAGVMQITGSTPDA